MNGPGPSARAGSLTVSQAALKNLPPLDAAQATAPQLGAGTVATSLQRNVLGVRSPSRWASRSRRASGQDRAPAADTATLKSRPRRSRARRSSSSLLPNGISVCAAKYLPRGVGVTTSAADGAGGASTSPRRTSTYALGAAPTGTCG